MPYEYVEINEPSVIVNSPHSLVESRFADTAAMAEQALSATQGYMEALSSLLGGLETSVADITVAAPELTVPTVTMPVFTGQSVEDVSSETFTANLEVSSPNIGTIDIPSNTTTPPVIQDIAMPSIQYPDEPQAPNFSGVSAPAMPEYVMPQEPDLSDLPPIPSAPNITLPTFESVFEDVDIPVPATFNWNSSPYNSDMWNSFLVKVIDGVENGGTGLDAGVEQMIYDRAALRLDIEADKAWRETEQYFATRKFRYPPGMMASKLQEISAETLRMKTDLTEKVAINQAELAQKNTHFMLEMGRQAEIILRDFHNAQENRMLDAAKTVVSSSVEVMNAYIAKRASNVEKYKADAAVFKDRLQAAALTVDIYKAEMEGVKVAGDVQKIQADIYATQLGGVEVLAKLYVAQIEGVKLVQSMDALKAEIFKTETDVYTARLTAEKLKIDIVNAQNETQRTKAQTYAEQLKGYIAEVEAAGILLRSQLAQVEAANSANQVAVAAYSAEAQAFSAKVHAKTQIAAVNVEGYVAEASAFSASANATARYYEVMMKQGDQQIAQAQFNLNAAVAQVDAATKSYVALKELQVKGAEGLANVSAQLTASALNAVHASASYGYSGSESTSASINYGVSASENHSIPHDPTS